MLKSENGGPNYTAALLIAIACEALSRLLDKPTKDFYLIEILTKHGLRKELAEDVASALRNGIAHTYDTRYVEAGSLRIELVISWRATEASRLIRSRRGFGVFGWFFGSPGWARTSDP